MPSNPPSRRDVARSLAAMAASGFLPALSSARAETARPKPEPEVAYYSDYYSFVGRDDKGHVYLAHDTNRGRTHDAYQANHFVAMYDEATGWIDLKGNVVYPNPGKLLDGLPASDHFSFEGRAAAGTVITGAEDGLKLTVSALPRTLLRQTADGIFWIGAAPASLEWRGRKIAGRVIFEYLERWNFNYFTSTPDRSFRNFNGLYLMTSSGHDFYMHAHQRTTGPDLTGRLVGMASWDTPAPVTDIDFKIPATAAVPYRTYRWPIAWQVGFTHAGARWQLELFTAERKLCGDWETGGFAMSVASGTLRTRDGSRQFDVAGWAELLI